MIRFAGTIAALDATHDAAAAVAGGAFALAAAGVALAPVLRQALVFVRPGRNVFFARWGFAQVLVAIVLGGLVGGAVERFVPPVSDGVTLGVLAGLVVAIAVAVRTATRTHPEGWRALGLASPGSARDFGAAVVALVLGAPALLAAALAWPLVLEPAARGFGPLATAALGGDALALVLVLVALPLTAELFLRGFCLPLFTQNFSEAGGILVAALMGAALFGTPAFGAQLVLGCLCGAVRLRTQRTAPCVVLHALYNAAALAVGAGIGDGGAPLWTPL